ncbi:MAG: SRPBCC family protein [Acidobacteriota bacterium]|jgi:uncharacterized membrane protein
MSEPVTHTIIVKRHVPDVYEAWANPERLPEFLPRVKRVVRTGERTSHWSVEGAKGRRLECDVECTRLEKNKRVAWNSTGGDVKTSGQVTFTGLPQHETQVTATWQFLPPDGPNGKDVAPTAEQEDMLMEDLLSFKRFIEGRDG